MYDFNTLVPAIDAKESPMRRRLEFMGYPDNVICYGVAEMKFKLLPEIENAAAAMVTNGYLGYSAGYPEYFDAVCSWMKKRHNWDISPEWLVQTYGVVQAIGIAIRALTNEGDAIIVQTPVYNHFMEEVHNNGRKVVENVLRFNNCRYEIDFEDFEKKIKDNDVKMFVFCSPHNPVGRVWTSGEIKKLAEICVENNVIVVSDEIHNDIVYRGEHTVYALISDEAADNCIVCTAPSKTFNIPGLTTSNIIIPNKLLRDKFIHETFKGGAFINPVGVAACRAAYENGELWTDEMCMRVKGNMELLEKCLAEQIPEAVLTKADATYLAWIDLGFLDVDDETLSAAIKNIGLCLNMGYAYGDTGKSHVRLNVGCPEEYVTEAVKMLKKAVDSVR